MDNQDQQAVAGAPTPALDDAPARLRLRDDAPFESPIAPLADFLAGGNFAAVRLEPGDDARALIPHFGRLKLIEVAFPKFRDGRGYSAARILREAGFSGEIRAAGDVLVDQLGFMRRVGFDSFAPNAPLDPGTVAATLDRFPHVYMKSSDGRPPVWALRHG
ncbi:oxidoreductase probably involved in sulfite reduction [alpha proteobacterium AAP81b]|nr:oxidoreductase probably involved in sulfite reduction [alpha proteobacterium AAP81b]